MVSLDSQRKKNISEMKTLRNHSQLKEQENSPEAANSETDLCSLMDTEFKREIMKILRKLRVNMKELRAGRNRNQIPLEGTRKYKEQPRRIRKFICRDAN